MRALRLGGAITMLTPSLPHITSATSSVRVGAYTTPFDRQILDVHSMPGLVITM